MPCEGFLVWQICACVLVDGARSCLSEGQCWVQQCVLGCVWVDMALGSLSANEQGCVPVGRSFGVRRPHCSLLAFAWGLVSVLRWRPLGEFWLINVSWGQKSSGSPKSWTEFSYFGGSGPTSYYSTKFSQATQHRRKNPKTNGERNTEQPRTLK